MPVDLTEVRELFLEESFENLDVMESSLLDLDVGQVDKELINSIFRAAHSIKGGAGIFKLEHIITFAHAAETLLDEMRNGEHLVTQILIDLLLHAVDVLRMMLSALQENTDYNAQEAQICQDELQQFVKTPIDNIPVDEEVSTPTVPEAQSPSATTESSSPVISAEPNAKVPSLSEEPSEEPSEVVKKQKWHIVFKPDLSMLKTGNDPINLFRELARLGELEVKVDTSQLPNFPDIDPQSCYLSWELILYANVERAIIEEIFEWVEDECELYITALDSSSVDESEVSLTKPLQTAEESPVLLESESSVTTPLAVLEESKVASEAISEIKSESPAILAPEESKVVSEVTSEPVQDSSAVPLPIPEQSLSVPESKNPSLPSPLTGENAQPDNHEKLVLVPEANDNTIHTHSMSHHATEANSIRVGIDKIDNLINMVGELVITQSMLDQIGENFENSRITHLRDGLSQLERNTRELQESVMRIRMLPISFSFNRFPRLVHDLSTQLGKKVELKLSGEHTELDKTVLEKMSDPLVHLVRNALDHGIETPEQRQGMGKLETGLLHLHAFHQGGNIIIQISDDGAGFNLEKIRAKAIQKGFLNSEEHPSNEQLYELIFQPGFSTAQQINNLSGRGVGMDVVRRNIRALGGTIEVKSQPGIGSTFSIRLPLTLAILDGQLVRVGEEIYILPLLSIIESLRAKPKLVNSFAGIAEVYKLRDEYIPILRLYNLFSISSSTTQLEQGLLVIVEGDGQKIGLFVDELLSQQQIVIKSLESNYNKVQGISGATILGDGSVALILDVAGLIQLFHTKTKAPPIRPNSLLGVRYEQ